MSGEAGGLILLPLALASFPALLGGLLVVGAVSAAASAVSAGVRRSRRREEERQAQQQAWERRKAQEQQRRDEQMRQQALRTSGVNADLTDIRSQMHASMDEQNRLYSEAEQQMFRELDAQREELQRTASQNDPELYRNYIASMQQTRTQMLNRVEQVRTERDKAYREKISASMADITAKMNKQYSANMGEIEKLKADAAQREELAKETADLYLTEAQNVISALATDHNGRKFLPRQVKILTEQYNQAVELYRKGKYESAVASAKDVTVGALEETFEADMKQQEWDSAYSLALALSEEVKAFLTSQETVTAEAKQYAEQHSGKTFEDEIVGMRIASYTGRMPNGSTRYDELYYRITEVYDILHGGFKVLSTTELHEYAEMLNNELYPAAAKCISDGIMNMNNAFSRQNMSEEIIDFFEEHNFEFSGYAYENGEHDKALHIGLANEETGEELIVTLAPELVNGDVQTRVDLKQIAGEEQNEERRAYYRRCVEDVVKGSNPYAKVDIKCNKATQNKLSSDTRIKGMLKTD